MDYDLFSYKQEDLENALQRAFKQQQRVNPSLKVNTDIQVCCSANSIHGLLDMRHSHQL